MGWNGMGGVDVGSDYTRIHPPARAQAHDVDAWTITYPDSRSTKARSVVSVRQLIRASLATRIKRKWTLLLVLVGLMAKKKMKVKQGETKPGDGTWCHVLVLIDGRGLWWHFFLI
jgi:hypothetical protein